MIKTALMNHQKIIVNFIKDKQYSGIFADYGLGKSLCILTHINRMRFKRSLIISTKTSIDGTWPEQIREHTDFRFVSLLGTRDQKLSALHKGIMWSQVDKGYQHSGVLCPIIFLLNFDGLKNIYHELLELNLDFLAVDESTKIKSVKTIRTKTLLAFGKAIPNRAIATGFPITEDLSDLYSQIKFLDGGQALGQSYYQFMDTYFSKVGLRYFPKRKRIKALLNKIKPFCIRITQDVLKLPPKIYKKVEIPLTIQQEKLLDEFNKMFRLEFGRVTIDTSYIFTLINKSLQITDGFIQDNNGNLEAMATNKDEALFDILEEINVSKNKVIIWFAFRFSLYKISSILKRIRYPFVSLTGDTKDVNNVVNKFLYSNCNILLSTIQKGNASLNLAKCQYAIYYSNSWSYDMRSNSEARIRRKGSEAYGSIFYTDLITKGSVEEKVHKCLQKKANLVDSLKKEFMLETK